MSFNLFRLKSLRRVVATIRDSTEGTGKDPPQCMLPPCSSGTTHSQRVGAGRATQQRRALTFNFVQKNQAESILSCDKGSQGGRGLPSLYGRGPPNHSTPQRP